MCFIVRLVVINSFGTFQSEIMNVSNEQFIEMVEMSKSFWITDTSFNIWTDNGAVIFPPDIIRQSILIIKKC